MNDGRVIFTDTGHKAVQCISRNGDISTIAGKLSVDGYQDGHTGLFSQPTGICIEGNTVYVVDTATCTLRIIVPINGLLVFLNNLNKLGKIFNFSNDKCDELDLNAAVELLQEIDAFLENSILNMLHNAASR